MTHPATESLYSYDHPLNNNFAYCSDLLNCLEPLLHALDWHGPKQTIIESLPHFVETLNLSDFHHVMEQLNYEVKHFKTRLNHLNSKLLPCLFIPTRGTACVILSAQDDTFTIVDGNTGKQIQIDKSRLSGHAYIYKPKSQTTQKNISWFNQLLKNYRGLVSQVLSISLLINILALATPLFIMSVYNHVISTESTSMLMDFALGLSIAFTAVMVLSFIRTRIQAYLSGKFDEAIGNSIFSRLINLPCHYTENAPIGQQISQIKGFNNIREFITSPTINAIIEIPFTLLFITIIAILGGTLALIPIGMIFVYMTISFIARHSVQASVHFNIDCQTKRQAFLIEALQQQRQIRYCQAEAIWLNRFKAISAETCMANFHTSLISAILNNLAEILMMFAGLMTLYFSAFKAMDNNLSTGALIAILILIWHTLTPIKALFTAYATIHQVNTHIKQLNRLMTLEPEYQHIEKHHCNELAGNSIQLENIFLRYNAQTERVLNNIHCNIPSNQLTVIYGSNSAGKTSLLKLLLKLHTPQSGCIYIGGKDICQINTKDLRQNIAYAAQTPQFFYGTIAQNLRLNNPLAMENDLTIACQQAGVYDDIMALSQSFETRIGDHKSTQLPIHFQQKLSLARALVKPADILLLDEPGNGLDPDQLAPIMKTLNELKQHKTIIITTHNPDYKSYADYVITLSQGSIVPSESGVRP